MYGCITSPLTNKEGVTDLLKTQGVGKVKAGSNDSDREEDIAATRSASLALPVSVFAGSVSCVCACERAGRRVLSWRKTSTFAKFATYRD